MAESSYQKTAQKLLDSLGYGSIPSLKNAMLSLAEEVRLETLEQVRRVQQNEYKTEDELRDEAGQRIWYAMDGETEADDIDSILLWLVTRTREECLKAFSKGVQTDEFYRRLYLSVLAQIEPLREELNYMLVEVHSIRASAGKIEMSSKLLANLINDQRSKRQPINSPYNISWQPATHEGRCAGEPSFDHPWCNHEAHWQLAPNSKEES